MAADEPAGLITNILTGLAGGTILTGMVGGFLARRRTAAEAGAAQATAEVQLSEDGRAWATELLREVRTLRGELDTVRATAERWQSRVTVLENTMRQAGLQIPL